MPDGPVRLSEAILQRFVADILCANGFSPEHAGIVAEVLVWANLRGIDSHGVSRIPRYLEMVEEGHLNPGAEPTIEERTAACFVLKANRAAGQVAMCLAVREAIDRAAESGIAWGAVCETTHVGAIGYYPLMIANENMAGIAFSASVPMMAYHGARTHSAGTNPIAIAVPGNGRAPLLLDMATAAAAAGRLAEAKDRGETIPEGWALDSGGNPTVEPFSAAVSLALGGPKGAGLSLMFECLASLTVDNPILAKVVGGPRPPPHQQNAVVIALNLGSFTNLSRFKQNVDDLASVLKAQPTVAGTEEILMPGERGARKMGDRRREGIPVPAGVWSSLCSTAERVGTEVPAVFD